MKIINKNVKGKDVVYILDNILELSYTRNKVGEMRDKLKESKLVSHWYNNGKETDETNVLSFFVTRSFNYNRDNSRDYVVEHHIVFDGVYILNDEGKTIDKIWV